MEIKERGFGTMTIGGKDRGFHIGTYQSKVFCDTRGIKLDDYFEELNKFNFTNSMANNQFVCDLLYSALVAYATFHDEPIDFTPVKVTFWADMASPDEVAKLFVVMAEMRRDTPKK
ncbi:hypothetical protein AUC43_15325 [Hymenobacter sedentarius]|uniref:Uncharacterized protein n=1 Tax=Hymenobacter sedentarius TaxID=1411621 RepID=A0A0U4CSD9_9BACT|nr:hypothetical protein [Hymenobacter sedentarius]ALW86334.1 hypothetical protein AUC43_15325 [Hymenobacter sedentarius]